MKDKKVVAAFWIGLAILGALFWGILTNVAVGILAFVTIIFVGALCNAASIWPGID